MYKFKNSLIAGLGMMALIAITSAMMPTPSQGQAGVVNQPSPVVKVIPNPPTMRALQAGLWNVGINNTASNPVLVRDVDNPALQPFQKQVSIQMPGDVSGGVGAQSFQVPAGKRLVIEYVSALVFVGANNEPEIMIGTQVNSVQAVHKLAVSPHTAGTFSVGHEVRLYADPGTDVVLGMQRNPNGPASMELTISGYFVDVP